MKKIFLCILLAIILPLSLAACGQNTQKKHKSPFNDKTSKKTAETNQTLTAGNYFVGYDLPGGIYTFSKNENSGDITIIRKGCPVENMHIDDTHHYARNMALGDIVVVHGIANIKALSTNSNTGSVKKRPGLPEDGEEDTRVDASITENCKVGDGDDAPTEGWYAISVEGKIHLKIAGNLGEDIDENMSSDGTGGPETYRNVYLRTGQQITIQNKSTDPDDEPTVRFDSLQASDSEEAGDSYDLLETEKEKQEANQEYSY